MNKLLLVFALVPVLLFSQTRKQRKALEVQKKADQQVISNFKSHIQFFTNKNPQGSINVSEEGEQAIQYITTQFKTIGLQPKGTNGYIQQFKLYDERQIEPGTFLKVNGILLAVKRDYFPLSFSASKSVTGMPAMALREKGVPWFADIKDWLEENAKNADFDITKTIQKEAARAALKGATALFLYNSNNLTDNLRFNKRDKTPPLSIPVIYITSIGYNKYFMDNSTMLNIELNVALKETIKNAKNVVGYIDNGAASNIVIATPYDRQYQEENSDITDKAKTYGLDDIISGTSMLIELARMLSASKAKDNNYTFIAYSCEDTLSQDSKWINNSAITSHANYIINLDRVGRYNEDKELIIEAYRTSPDWIANIKPLADKTLEVTFDSSSVEGKNTSIYQVKIPVLNFLINPDRNYNNISSHLDKMNYEGELHIARFIYRLIEATDAKGKLAFLKDGEPGFIALRQTARISAQNSATFKSIKQKNNTIKTYLHNIA